MKDLAHLRKPDMIVGASELPFSAWDFAKRVAPTIVRMAAAHGDHLARGLATTSLMFANTISHGTEAKRGQRALPVPRSLP